MKYLYTIFIISMLIVSGCSINESANELKLTVKNEEIKSDKTTHGNTNLSQEDVDKLNQEIRKLQAENENKKETITVYQEAFELLQTDTNIIVDTLSIFSPEKVQKGSQVAGLTVLDIKKEPANGATSYFVDFTGEFEVIGSIIHNQVGGSKYSIMVEEKLVKLPHSLHEFEQRGIFFYVENDEELEKAMGEKLDNLSHTEKLKITAIFKNYSYNYVPESDVSNSAEFVRLASQSQN